MDAEGKDEYAETSASLIYNFFVIASDIVYSEAIFVLRLPRRFAPRNDVIFENELYS